jgi:hypothetical protein
VFASIVWLSAAVQTRKVVGLAQEKSGRPGARSLKQAGSAVELRLAPEGALGGAPAGAFSIAPPKAGRGTECARPELSPPPVKESTSLKLDQRHKTVPQSVPVSILIPLSAGWSGRI